MRIIDGHAGPRRTANLCKAEADDMSNLFCFLRMGCSTRGLFYECDGI
jgi:hypothetical protein